MYLCQAKHKRVKCKHAVKMVEHIETQEDLDMLQDEYKNKYKIGDKMIDWICFQEHDVAWKKCKCLRSHTKEV